MLQQFLPAGRGAHRGPTPQLWLSLAQVAGGRQVLAHTSYQSQSSGKWNFVEAWLPALLAPQWLQAALGKGAKLLFPSLDEGTALTARQYGPAHGPVQLRDRAGGRGWLTCPLSIPQEDFLRASNKGVLCCFFF